MNAIDPAVVAYLHSLKQGGVQPGLERMQAFVAELGDPQDRIPVIHIAGTNGKGSVAAMVESIFRLAGWRTGLYTSPHLVKLGERIQVGRQPLSPAELVRHVTEMRPAVEARIAASGAAGRPSYFEFMTALAFRHFAQRQCDVAIIEAGMGGRRDATNVVIPEVSVITSVGLDHCEFLGSSIPEIAAEKSGIIKPERPVVIGRLPVEAEIVIRAAAAARNARVFSVADVYGEDLEQYPRTNLPGEYQRINAATATLVARQVEARWRFSDGAINAALGNVDWPGRWQHVDVGGRQVIIDTSHNAEGATAALAGNLAELVTTTNEAPVVVTGVLGRERAKPLLDVICRYARELHLVIPVQSRACSFTELEALVPPSFGGRVVRSSVATIFPAPGECLPEQPAAVPVVVTGSIYLAGEVLARLQPERGPAEHDLQDF